jgi:Ecdysteroid kinase-like family
VDYSKFCNSLYSKKEITDIIVGGNIKTFVEIMKTWKEAEKFVPAMERYAENYYDLGSKIYQEAKGPFAFNVLNHGDFHNRNLLFKMDSDDKYEDFVFVKI